MTLDNAGPSIENYVCVLCNETKNMAEWRS